MSDDQMLREHTRTFHGFIRLLGWSVAAVVVTLILMWFLLL